MRAPTARFVHAQAFEITTSLVRSGRAADALAQAAFAPPYTSSMRSAITRRTAAGAVVLGALAAALVVAIVVPVTRAPAFHVYADQRERFGIPHAGDALSNLPFLIVAAWAMRRATTNLERLACAGVAAIAFGSAAYHVSPRDVTLALDWAPIAIALMLMTAVVIDDRLGERAGRIAAVVGIVLAIGSVVVWIAGGGTGGLAGHGRGTVTPYGAVQALGIALPPLVALSAPGRIPRVPLLGAVALFALARLCAANDRQLLDAIGVSGHSLKHVVAACAAACALYAITSRASSASRASS